MNKIKFYVALSGLALVTIDNLRKSRQISKIQSALEESRRSLSEAYSKVKAPRNQ